MSLVSVVIPTYNRSESIERALQSVLAQTYQVLETIVVDDGSTDDTSTLIAATVEKDQRVRYLRHSRNEGAQAARNTGIRAAHGRWIAFLDADDWWLPNSLETRLAVAQSEGVKVIHSECYVIRGSDEIRLFGVSPMSGWVYQEVLARPGPVFPALLVEKTALEAIGYLDERLRSWQEWDTSIRLAKDFRFGFVPTPTFVYDCRGVDTISKDLLRDARGYEQLVRKHTLAMLTHAGPRVLSRHYGILGSRYLTAGHREAAVRCKLLAFLWWPFRPRTILRRLGWRLSRPDRAKHMQS